MTIITQTGLILNYRFIREIGLYDAEDDNRCYFCLISAKNDKGEDITLAAYSTSDEGEIAYSRLTEAFQNGREVFSFDEVDLRAQKKEPDKSEPEKSSYRNRFIEKG